MVRVLHHLLDCALHLDYFSGFLVLELGNVELLVDYLRGHVLLREVALRSVLTRRGVQLARWRFGFGLAIPIRCRR